MSANVFMADHANLSLALPDIREGPPDLYTYALELAVRFDDLARLVRESRGQTLFAAGPQEAVPRLKAAKAQIATPSDRVGHDRNTPRDHD
jgi:hypothetical protein